MRKQIVYTDLIISNVNLKAPECRMCCLKAVECADSCLYKWIHFTIFRSPYNPCILIIYLVMLQIYSRRPCTLPWQYPQPLSQTGRVHFNIYHVRARMNGLRSYNLYLDYHKGNNWNNLLWKLASSHLRWHFSYALVRNNTCVCTWILSLRYFRAIICNLKKQRYIYRWKVKIRKTIW